MLAEIIKKQTVKVGKEFFTYDRFLQLTKSALDEVHGKEREDVTSQQLGFLTIWQTMVFLGNGKPKKQFIVSDDMLTVFANTDVDFEEITKMDLQVAPGTFIFMNAKTLSLLTPEDVEGEIGRPGDIFMQLWDVNHLGNWMSMEMLLYNGDCLTTANQASSNEPGVSLLHAQRFMGAKTKNIISNILLYITSHPEWIERVESPEKPIHKKLGGRKRKQIAIENQYRVIHKIGIPKQITKSIKAADFDEYGNPLKQYTINKRFMVRGHWRNQTCGKKNQSRKYIFIAPFWKGPEDAPLVDHIYKIN